MISASFISHNYFVMGSFSLKFVLKSYLFFYLVKISPNLNNPYKFRVLLVNCCRFIISLLKQFGEISICYIYAVCMGPSKASCFSQAVQNGVMCFSGSHNLI